MFPISIKGEVAIGSSSQASADAALNGIERELKAAKATEIHRQGNIISFRGGLFRLVTNLNILNPVGYGEIEVFPSSSHTIRYRLSLMQTLVVTTALVVVMSVVAAVSFGSALFALILLVAVWFWLVGMNYLIASIRLPAFIQKAATAQSHSSPA